MLQYFQYYPKILYAQSDDSVQQILTNILHKVGIRKEVIQNITVFETFTLRDGDSIEIVADRYYGSPQYHWVVMFCNNIIDPYYDWHLDEPLFIKMMVELYGSVETAMSTVHHYKDSYGHEIDQTTYNSLPASERELVSAYDHWSKVNENKRHIRLIHKDFLSKVEKEMYEIFQTLR